MKKCAKIMLAAITLAFAITAYAVCKGPSIVYVVDRPSMLPL